MSVFDSAITYSRRGWFVVPIPDRSKNPGFKDWPQWRLTEADLPKHFNGSPQNIGVLLGEPSGWIIDVDLDHPRCVQLADQYLPPTPAVFGRPGKPRSHRIYRVSAPITTKKHKSKSAGMLVELRSTGLQTVFPPSVHESGEPITWDTEHAEPAEIDPDVLRSAVDELANAVLVELGEKAAPKFPKAARLEAESASDSNKAERTTQRIRKCVSAMLRLQMADQNDGSSRLFAAACRVVEHNLNDVQGIKAIHDYARQRPFPQEWTKVEIVARIRDAEKKTDRGVIRRVESCKDRRRVLIGPDEHRVVSETVEAITRDSTIFQRGGVLVRIIREQPEEDIIQRNPEAATIGFLPQPSLRERMTKFADFVSIVQRRDTEEEVAAHPPPWLVAAVDARGEWPGIRRLTGVSGVPILRPDGSLWQVPGYDAVTGVLYEPTGSLPIISDAPNFTDVQAAVAQLYDLICDFHFESPEHRSAWLAGLLTPLARFAFDGPAPLFLIDANVRGAGKGLLAQTIGEIVLGHEMPVSSYAHDPEEMRKKITSIALAGDRMVHLDNLDGNFGNGTLDRALTATRWKDRLLGKNQNVDLPLIPVWYGTGNNVAVAADTTRRVMHIRMDVLEENPEERTGFKYPELITHIKQHRGSLLTAAITILRGYCVVGMPRQSLTAFGSFEGWSRLVREAIVWAGEPDPCLTRVKLAESADTSRETLHQLIAAWQGYDVLGQGIVVSDMVNRLYAREFAPQDEASVAMRAALENLVGCGPGRNPNARQVAAKLRGYRRRVHGGWLIDTNPQEDTRNGAVWRLKHAKS